MARTSTVLLLTGLVWLLALVAAPAQDVGALRGTVQDADFLSPLPGASVIVDGTSQGARTDENGNFNISGLPAGRYTLMVSKDGYVRSRVPDVVVIPGQVKQANVSLTGEVVELDEFVVAPNDLIEETSLVSAVNIRTEAATFVEVLGAEFFTQTGASDAAKALSKAAGINVAEGKFVIVRGLNDRYNSVTLNGLRVPSSDPDRRAVALDLFPAAVIKDIRTSKTFLPDMPGEATGASIDIVTKSVPDNDFYKVKIGVGYNTNTTGSGDFLSYRDGGTDFLGTGRNRALPTFIRSAALPGPGTFADTPEERTLRQRVNNSLSTELGTKEEVAPMDFSFEASMGHRIEDFMGAPAGFTVAIDYSKKYGYNDDDFIGRYTFNIAPPVGSIASIDRQATVRVGQETMRAGLLVSAGFELDPDSEITATYFFNRIAEDRASLQFGELDPNINPDTLEYREAIAYTERQLRAFQIAGQHAIHAERDGKINWAAAYNQSYQLEPDHRFARSFYFPFNESFQADPTPTVPEFQRIWRELNDENYSIRLDVETDIFEDAPPEHEAKVKFGTLLDYSDRRYRADSFAYQRGLENAQFPNFIPGFQKPRTEQGQTWGDVFLLGNTAVDDPSVFNIDATTYLYRPNVPEEYTAEQIISAGYATFSVSLGADLDLVFGARVETTDLKVQASPIYIYPEQSTRLALLSPEQQADFEFINLLDMAFFGDPAAQQDPRIAARSRSNIQETHLLPAFSLTWDFSDEARVRAAISRTIARPSFKEMAPVPFLSVESGDLFVGNVDLEMSEVMNYDVRWEWFPEPASVIAVSLFSKAIQNPIELSVEGDLMRFINVEEGHVFGFELEYQRSLEFVAEELRHWSIGTNYSYIQSSAERPVRPGASPSIYGPNRRLQGQPDYIVNFNLTYDNPDSGLMAGLFFNAVGPQLFAVAADFQDPDIFQEPYSTLDFVLSQDIGDNCKVTFRAANLLNSETKRYYNNSQRPVYSSRDTGITYSLSLTLDF